METYNIFDWASGDKLGRFDLDRQQVEELSIEEEDGAFLSSRIQELVEAGINTTWVYAIVG